MLSFLFFIIGLWLSSRQAVKLELLGIEADRERLTTAARTLMIPFLINLILVLIAVFITEGDLARSLEIANSLAFFSLLVDIGAAIIAYTLLRRTGSADTMYSPGAYDSKIPTGTPHPSIMTTQQAAVYLNIPEQRILDAISQGELPAARMNNRYQIARRALDEFKETLTG